ncbi:Transcription activator of gluconeogenesis ERT1 [Neolecta irregularis DAH-3]|uniref:Transcription activator of gluconeogenesis ERT1 n=1 Tax=Neolecta irregularis (strain DAH-3) TaxID=1198029 RepID=A0A1U7LRA9_NEOID|nr:Transcription activator of gluconeogenesis ERT1 [Neolecta irregularis DAH-3]|eukprot:OLL25206.1 Transcription activator of gluconeogenesis ERT1 [Neolecta irregularis DAH-3]
MILEKDSAAQVLLDMRQNRSSTPPEEESSTMLGDVSPTSGLAQSRYSGQCVQSDYAMAASSYDSQMRHSPNSQHNGSSGADDNPGYKRRTRKNTTRACTNCRKARQGCDGMLLSVPDRPMGLFLQFRSRESCILSRLTLKDGRPCKRCVVYGKSHTCEDAEHKNRGRPRNEVSSRHHPYFDSSSNINHHPEKHMSSSACSSASATARSFIDSPTIHAICTTLDFTCASTTPTIRALLGFYPQEIEGRSFKEFIHDEDLELFTRLAAALQQTRLSKPDSYFTANCLELQKRGETVFSGLASSMPVTTETLRLRHADGTFLLITIKVVLTGRGNAKDIALADCIVIQLVRTEYLPANRSPLPAARPITTLSLSPEGSPKFSPHANPKLSPPFYQNAQFPPASPHQERVPHPFFDGSPRASMSSQSAFGKQLPPLNSHFPEYPRRRSSYIQPQFSNPSWPPTHRVSDCSSTGPRSSVSTTITAPDSRPGSLSFAKSPSSVHGSLHSTLPRGNPTSLFLNWEPISRNNSTTNNNPYQGLFGNRNESISLPPLSEPNDSLRDRCLSSSSRDILPPLSFNPAPAPESFIRKSSTPQDHRSSLTLPPINVPPS